MRRVRVGAHNRLVQIFEHGPEGEELLGAVVNDQDGGFGIVIQDGSEIGALYHDS